MLDNPDFGGIAAGQAVASGLQGLVEAYKIKLGQAQEEQKVKQAGFNSAAMMPYRMGMLDSRDAAIKERAREFDALAPTGEPTISPDGKFMLQGRTWKPVPGKGTQANADKLLHSAGGAYSALDDALGLAKQFTPESSAAAATARAPYTWLKSKLSQTSPENNLADKTHEAATLFAAAANQGGGARMSDAEINNMATAMGGHGIGDTYENLAVKHAQLKDNLAIKLGLSRADIEDYVAAQKDPAKRLLNKLRPPAPGGAPVPVPVPGAGAGGMTRIKASDGSLHDVPDVEAARKIDPGLAVVQ